MELRQNNLIHLSLPLALACREKESLKGDPPPLLAPPLHIRVSHRYMRGKSGYL